MYRLNVKYALESRAQVKAASQNALIACLCDIVPKNVRHRIGQVIVELVGIINWFPNVQHLDAVEDLIQARRTSRHAVGAGPYVTVAQRIRSRTGTVTRNIVSVYPTASPAERLGERSNSFLT